MRKMDWKEGILDVEVFYLMYWLPKQYSYLQIVNQRAKSLSSANLVLKEDLQPLNTLTVDHETLKVDRVGRVDLHQIRPSDRGRDVSANAPGTGDVGVLVFIAEQEVVQKLGTLLVRGILKDSTTLTPRDEEAFLGNGDVERGGGNHADTASEGHRVRVVGLAHHGGGSSSAAHPTRVLGEQVLEPAVAVLLHPISLSVSSDNDMNEPELTPSQTRRELHHRRWGR